MYNIKNKTSQNCSLTPVGYRKMYKRLVYFLDKCKKNTLDKV